MSSINPGEVAAIAAVEPFSLHLGDCIEVMRTLADNCVDAIVTDPPYHLTTGKRGGTGPASLNVNSPAGRARISTGFMGKSWDGGDIAHSVELWTEALRVLKPGGHLLAFSGTRTQHRMVCAIEDAGFDIRDQVGWAYGSGFPKSRNIAEQDMDGEDAGTWAGWGTALKPAWEPICVARKPLAKGLTVAANVLAHGTGGLNIDGCRVPSTDGQLAGKYASVQNAGARANSIYGNDSRDRAGSAPHDAGRWPANIIHDGSAEVAALFPDSTGSGPARNLTRGTRDGEGWGMAGQVGELRDAGTGSAARFFYCAKASRTDRHEGLEAPGNKFTHGGHMREVENMGAKRGGNHHPTVKPTDLMAYLVRLVTPPGGLVLDPFMGSGSTGKACMREGFRFIGIDMTAEYLPIATARIEHELAQVAARAAATQEAAELAARQVDLFAEVAP